MSVTGALLLQFGPEDRIVFFLSVPGSPLLSSLLASVRLHRFRGTMYLFSGKWDMTMGVVIGLNICMYTQKYGKRNSRMEA